MTSSAKNEPENQTRKPTDFSIDTILNKTSPRLTPKTHLSPTLGLTPNTHLSPTLELAPNKYLSPPLGLRPNPHLSPTLGLTPNKRLSPTLELTPNKHLGLTRLSPTIKPTPNIRLSPTLRLTPNTRPSPPLRLSPKTRLSPTNRLSPNRFSPNLQTSPRLNLNASFTTATSLSPSLSSGISERGVEDARNEFSFECASPTVMQPFPWLQCTRYCPPKVPRKREGGPQKRQLGRHPRIPFTSQQLSILEDIFRQSPYLSSEEVTRLSAILQLADIRVKIWFQNRRARERRERLQTDRRTSPNPEVEVKQEEDSHNFSFELFNRLN